MLRKKVWYPLIALWVRGSDSSEGVSGGGDYNTELNAAGNMKHEWEQVELLSQHWWSLTNVQFCSGVSHRSAAISWNALGIHVCNWRSDRVTKMKGNSLEVKLDSEFVWDHQWYGKECFFIPLNLKSLQTHMENPNKRREKKQSKNKVRSRKKQKKQEEQKKWEQQTNIMEQQGFKQWHNCNKQVTNLKKELQKLWRAQVQEGSTELSPEPGASPVNALCLTGSSSTRHCSSGPRRLPQLSSGSSSKRLWSAAGRKLWTGMAWPDPTALMPYRFHYSANCCFSHQESPTLVLWSIWISQIPADIYSVSRFPDTTPVPFAGPKEAHVAKSSAPAQERE